MLKCLTIVDDATHEAVAIEVERAISGIGVTRVLDRLALTRGLPRVIRTNNDKEFCGFTHLLHARTVIETWRREYDEERPRKALGGLTPSAYAEHLVANAATMTLGL